MATHSPRSRSVIVRIAIVLGLSFVGVLMLRAGSASATVNQFTDTFVDEPASWYMGEFACTGKPTTVAGSGLESGSVRVTETADPEGAHVQIDVKGYVDLYEAFGPPWDVRFGAYVGRWTYSVHNVEEWNPGGTASLGGATVGRIVFADGNTARLKVSFKLLLDREDGPKLFFAKAACGGE